MLLRKRPVGRRAAVAEGSVARVAPHSEPLQNDAKGVGAALPSLRLLVAPPVDETPGVLGDLELHRPDLLGGDAREVADDIAGKRPVGVQRDRCPRRPRRKVPRPLPGLVGMEEDGDTTQEQRIDDAFP